MSTKMLIAVFAGIMNFWLAFGWIMPVPEMVSDICVHLLKAEAWTIGLCLVFSGLFFYDQMVLVVEEHKRCCNQNCRIWSGVDIPNPDDLSLRETVREARSLSREKFENALQFAHCALQTNKQASGEEDDFRCIPDLQ